MSTRLKVASEGKCVRMREPTVRSYEEWHGVTPSALDLSRVHPVHKVNRRNDDANLPHPLGILCQPERKHSLEFTAN